jgi:hypothetical protein
MIKRESTKSDTAKFDPTEKTWTANTTEPGGLTQQTSSTAIDVTPTRVGSNQAGVTNTVIVPGTGRLTLGLLPDEVITEAVLNHLRFQRARGIVEIDVEDVARALSLSIAQVKKAVSNLRSEGAKLEG